MTATVHPLDVAEAAEVLRGASMPQARLQLRRIGHQVRLGRHARSGRPHRQHEFDRHAMLTHHPGDMTASVQAGMRLADLQRVLAGAGQWLAIDPPTESLGATIGGLLATGEAGPRRLQYGSMRDLAIGATLVLADGSVVHSGSHVIKNVAGYDLTKLFFGSFGTLGLVGEVIVRLHPVPVSSATVVAERDSERTPYGPGWRWPRRECSSAPWNGADSRVPARRSYRRDPARAAGLQGNDRRPGCDRVQQVLRRAGPPSGSTERCRREASWRVHAEQTGPDAASPSLESPSCPPGWRRPSKPPSGSLPPTTSTSACRAASCSGC